MSFELMYITNQVDIGIAAENAGVDRIWIDLEILGKEERQKNYDSVKSKHSVEDIKRMKQVLKKARLQVRVNPIHDASEKEINAVIENGADIVMLPMFKTVAEVKQFISLVAGRATTLLLLETKEAEEILDDILELDGIDEIHIGLNDLHISHQKKFMFELMVDGTVDKICEKISKRNIPYGVGGIASLGQGLLPAEIIFAEDFRQGCSRVILSRGFIQYESDLEKFEKTFKERVSQLRSYENELITKGVEFFSDNRTQMEQIIKEIV